MRFEIIDNKLILYFAGELNSYNSDEIEQDIDRTLKNQSFTSLILNLGDLVYISSAGLRIVLKLKQKYGDVSIVEASLEVYDVLTMTGFVNMMPIKKALKSIDVDGCAVVGEGFFSTVYRIDKDMIIKVFNRVSDPAQIERELALAKQAFVLGIPSAISFDIVKVKDKLGVRFEMLDCETLKTAFVKYPDRYDELVNKYVGLLKKINTTECYSPEIPNSKDIFLNRVEVIKDLLKPDYYKKVKSLIESIPERHTFVHGDCHFKNIMVQGDNLLLIDMDTLSVGHPIFELALLYAPYVAFEEDDKGNNLKFLGVDGEYTKQLFIDLFTRYFGEFDEDKYNKVRIVSYVHMLGWTLLNLPTSTNRLEGCKARLMELLDKYNDVNID